MMRTLKAATLCLLVLCLSVPARAAQGSPGEWVALELPSGAPARWVLSLEWGGEELEVELWRSQTRSSSYRVREMSADGSLREVPQTPAATYHGVVRGDASRGAAIAFVQGRVEGFVEGQGGEEIWIERRRADGPVPTEELHWIHEGVTGGFTLENCGALQPGAEVDRVSGPVEHLGAGCMWVADLAFDTDHEYYSLHGSTAACTQHIEAVLNAVNYGYARDVLIRHEISEIIVRSSEPDPYSTPGTDGLLDDFVNHWQSQQGGVTRDVAHLMTARPLSDNVIGLAYVGVVCSQSWGYGWTWGQNGLSSETSILGHELGHNWSAPHCLDTDYCVWMCGGCHEFGPITGRQIMDYASGRACLGTGPGHPTPVPPLANPDQELGGDLVIDVLSNDHDGNCESLFISAFDANTSEGGSVTLSPGSGASGDDQLVFTPLPGWEGMDTFEYTAMDGAGLTDSAEVTVVIQDDLPEIMTILRLDESGSTSLVDSGPGMSNGSLFGGPDVGQPGARAGTGTSIGFDGVDDYGRLNGPRRTDALRLKFSVSAWVQSAGVSGDQILFGNPGSWSVGLQGNRPFIRRTGGSNPAPSLYITPGQWTHLVYTFEAGEQARFYVDGALGGSLNIGGATGSAGGTWYLGSADGSDDFFTGLIDDLHVYDGVLTSTQVAYLFANPGDVVVACTSPEVYCEGAPNSVSSQGAGIGWIGTQSIWADEFILFAHSVPSGQFGIFYYGPNQLQAPFGDGFRCVGAGLLGTYRLPVQQADSFGDVYCPLDFNSPPASAGGGLIVDGMEWNFQFWYRDPPGVTSSFNLSNALRVEFCP
ncbi:MAG: M12 family metallo-peptidase [Planctomycetes bacterium]|nr:M12 family metallo-peptidase [Planctomycetota bacterium]